MITVEIREEIRRAYFIEQKSKRQIERESGHSRHTINKALSSAEARPIRSTDPARQTHTITESFA